jgi:hypothetical protein
MLRRPLVRETPQAKAPKTRKREIHYLKRANETT